MREKIERSWMRLRAWTVPQLAEAIYDVRAFGRKRGPRSEIAFWLISAVVAAMSCRYLQASLSPHISAPVVASLQTLTVTIGGAMIGATAIASSFVLFAIQVNVERLPYGLFQRFSSDWKLLTAFALSFFVAIGGASLSLVSKADWVAAIIMLEAGAVIAVLRLLLFAYRRSLQLVNPFQQLGLMYRRADRKLEGIDRYIRWTTAHLIQPADQELDVNRRMILDASPNWDRALGDTIEQAVAFARRAGEQGDLEISAAALNTVVGLNRRYIDIKGRTFFANNLLIENPLVTDPTINLTLEALRRLRNVALARRDEPQLEQIFRAHLSLVHVYLTIQYVGMGSHKSHALLAAGYLQRSVETVVAQHLVDSAMAGVRVMADAATAFVRVQHSTEATGLIDKIAMLGMVGSTQEKFHPLTLTVMEQFTKILLNLFRSEEHDPGYAIRELRGGVDQIATMFLKLPDSPLLSIHSSYLGPFFSGTSYSSFRHHMAELANALQIAPTEDIGERVAAHIESWADGLYNGQKRLLLLAVEKRSHFTFDMIHFITGITEVFLAIARSPFTRSHTKDELEKHARWLASTLTWIPRDKETVQFVENLSLRSEVFNLGLMALGRDWPEGLEVAWKLAIRWAIEGGRYQTGWGTLERWLTALCALALRPGVDWAERLKAELAASLALPEAPVQDIRDHAARELRRKAETLFARELELNIVERVLAANEHAATRTLLREIANILSPNTAEEPVELLF